MMETSEMSADIVPVYLIYICIICCSLQKSAELYLFVSTLFNLISVSPTSTTSTKSSVSPTQSTATSANANSEKPPAVLTVCLYETLSI